MRRTFRAFQLPEWTRIPYQKRIDWTLMVLIKFYYSWKGLCHPYACISYWGFLAFLFFCFWQAFNEALSPRCCRNMFSLCHNFYCAVEWFLIELAKPWSPISMQMYGDDDDDVVVMISRCSSGNKCVCVCTRAKINKNFRTHRGHIHYKVSSAKMHTYLSQIFCIYNSNSGTHVF